MSGLPATSARMGRGAAPPPQCLAAEAVPLALCSTLFLERLPVLTMLLRNQESPTPCRWSLRCWGPAKEAGRPPRNLAGRQGEQRPLDGGEA